MKKVFILGIIVFFFLVNFASAETATAKAYVRLEIINDVPEIETLNFNSNVYYEDSVLKINSEVKDEVPDEVKLNYKWYINGNFVSDEENLEYNFKPNDKVICVLTAEDAAGQKSEEEFIETGINKSPASAVVIKNTASFLGANNMDTKKALELQEQGLMSVTGFVVNESPVFQPSSISIILLTIFLLGLITLNISLRRRINKEEHIS